MEIDNDIRFYRQLKGLSMYQLGKEVGVNYSSLKRYEVGETEPKISDAIKIAEYFYLPVHELFFKKGSKGKRIIPDELLIRE